MASGGPTDALSRLQRTIVGREESLYRQFVRATGVVTTALVLAFLFAAAGVPDLSPTVVDFLRAAATFSLGLFVLVGLIQFLFFLRAYERGAETVAETAEELETAADEVKETAAELDEAVADVDEATEEVEGAVAEVDRAAQEVESVADEAADPEIADEVTERTGTAKEAADEVKEQADAVKEQVDEAKQRTETAKETADEVKETVERERDRLPDAAADEDATEGDAGD